MSLPGYAVHPAGEVPPAPHAQIPQMAIGPTWYLWVHFIYIRSIWALSCHLGLLGHLGTFVQLGRNGSKWHQMAGSMHYVTNEPKGLGK